MLPATGRLGAACYALADYGSAVEAYTAGLKVEKANATLVAGLAQAEAKLAQVCVRMCAPRRHVARATRAPF